MRVPGQRTLLLLTALVIATLAGTSGATVHAQEQYPPDDECSGLSLSRSTVPRGGDVTASTGPCWEPGTTVALRINPPLGTTTADADGEMSKRLTIPMSTSVGRHTITAAGTGTDGEPLELSAPITVTAAASGGAGRGRDRTADTGSSLTMPLAAVGLGLVLAGSVAVVGSRRRRRIVS